MLKNKIIANLSRTGNKKISFNKETLPNKLTDESVMADKFFKETIQEILNSPILKPRERDTIIKHFGLDGGKPMSKVEIAKNFGVSDSRIDQILKRAFRKLNRSFDVIDRLTYFYPLKNTEYSEKIKNIKKNMKDVERVLENEIYRQVAKERLPKYLNDNSINVITMLYGLDGDEPKAITVVAEELGLSILGVVEIKNKSLRELSDSFLTNFRRNSQLWDKVWCEVNDRLDDSRFMRNYNTYCEFYAEKLPKTIEEFIAIDLGISVKRIAGIIDEALRRPSKSFLENIRDNEFLQKMYLDRLSFHDRYRMWGL